MLEIIPPAAELAGKVILPGSKSITNRALLVAALADGVSEIRGALKSDDTKFMSAGLRKFGIAIDEPDATTFVVRGKNGKLAAPTEKIFLGNAGTATRFLTAAAILVDGATTIDGDEWMRKRPIGDLVDSLRQLGARVEFLEKENCPPLRISSGGKIPGGKIKIRADISSQFLSAILMIAPLAESELEIELAGKLASAEYVEITKKVRTEFLRGGKYSATNFAVEPDASSATYFWAAEKLLGAAIEFENLPAKWMQPDAAAREIISQFPNLPDEIDGAKFPDAVPTLAVLAAFSGREINFSGIANLRVKECDRIRALAVNLNRIRPGLAEEVGDELRIFGDAELAKNGRPAEIETFDDHRIAMSFFLAGLRIPGIRIDNPDCVAKSFPNFWEIWEQLGVKFFEMKFDQNLVLVGMRGSGKTAVGKILAQFLDFDFVDLDAELEKSAGAKIPEIVAKNGWDFFRNLESAAAAKFAARKNLVISTGGGVVLRNENVANLKKKWRRDFPRHPARIFAKTGRGRRESPESHRRKSRRRARENLGGARKNLPRGGGCRSFFRLRNEK